MITGTISRKRNTSHWQEASSNIGNRLAHFAIWFQFLLLVCLSVIVSLPGIFLPLRRQPLALAAIVGLWLICWAITKRSSRINYLLSWPLYLLLGWLPINLLVATTTISTWQACGYLCLGIVLFLTCLHHPRLQQQPVLLTLFLVLIIGSGLFLGAPLVQWKSEFRLFYLPLYDWLAMVPINLGETIHANVLAGALVLLLPLTTSLALPVKRFCHVHIETESGKRKALAIRTKHNQWAKLCKIIGWLGVLLLISLVVLTQSRGGYLGAISALFVLFILRWPRLNYGLPLLALPIGLFLQKISLNTILEILGADNTFGGSEVRTVVWSSSLQAFQDFTWTGIGIGGFRQVMPLLYPSPVINSEMIPHAHNLLLQIGLDLGLPGLVAYIGFYLTMVGMAIAVLRRMRSPKSTATALGATWDGDALIAPPEVGVSISTGRFMRQLSRLERTRQQHWALAAGCLAALVGMQVHGLLDAVTWGNKLAFIPWLIFAQITLLYRYQNDEE